MPVDFYANTTVSTAGTYTSGTYGNYVIQNNYYTYYPEPEIKMVKGSVVGPWLEEEPDEPALWDQI